MIEVTRESDDKLSDQMWRFNVFGNGAGTALTMRVQSYACRERATTRHKMKVIGLWDSFDQRSYHSTIKATEVPVPDDVVNEALGKVQVTLELPDTGKVALSLTSPLAH